jgi:hypothetical protein
VPPHFGSPSLKPFRKLQDVIARDPAYAAAYYLGRILAHLGQIEDARIAYRQGLDASTAAGDQKTRSEFKKRLICWNDDSSMRFRLLVASLFF